MNTKIVRLENKNKVGQPQRIFAVMVLDKSGEWKNITGENSGFPHRYIAESKEQEFQEKGFVHLHKHISDAIDIA